MSYVNLRRDVFACEHYGAQVPIVFPYHRYALRLLWPHFHSTSGSLPLHTSEAVRDSKLVQRACLAPDAEPVELQSRPAICTGVIVQGEESHSLGFPCTIASVQTAEFGRNLDRTSGVDLSFTF